MAASPLTCAGCGATLDVSSEALVLTCPYCGEMTELTVKPADLDPDVALTERLIAGYDKPSGKGERLGLYAMGQRGWQEYERGIWPVGGKASSTYQYGLGEAAIVGPPAMYPHRGGDKTVWRPRTALGGVEWIEATYPEDTPAVTAVRVFETRIPGSTFAVTVRDKPGDPQQLVWEGPPRAPRYDVEAEVVEVTVSPPRPLHAVRAYMINEGVSQVAIDTIGLVAAEPLPEEKRAVWPPKKSMRGWIIAGLIALVAVLWLILR